MKENDERKRSEEMLLRLGKLEENNKQLKDENMALKLENFDLKQKAKYTQVHVSVREDPWKFPNAVLTRSEKASATKDHETMENHGNSTTAMIENSENPPGNIDSTDFTFADAVVHGQRNYARAKSTALRCMEKKKQIGKKWEQKSEIVLELSGNFNTIKEIIILQMDKSQNSSW